MGKTLSVGGLVSITTVDYPDHIASVIFLQGCSWRCKYCHNSHLQSILPSESLPWEDVLNLLKSRKGFIEAVVFSGGEPLLQDALFDAICEVKDIGFLVGLHTAGIVPSRLAQVIQYVDWIGFDIKNGFEHYQSITNIKNSGDVAYESLRIAINANVDLEVRITMFELIDTGVISDTLKDLSKIGVKTVVLQKCRDKNENIVEHPIFSDKLLLEELSKCFESFSVR